MYIPSYCTHIIRHIYDLPYTKIPCISFIQYTHYTLYYCTLYYTIHYTKQTICI